MTVTIMPPGTLTLWKPAIKYRLDQSVPEAQSGSMPGTPADWHSASSASLLRVWLHARHPRRLALLHPLLVAVGSDSMPGTPADWHPRLTTGRPIRSGPMPGIPADWHIPQRLRLTTGFGLTPCPASPPTGTAALITSAGTMSGPMPGTPADWHCFAAATCGVGLAPCPAPPPIGTCSRGPCIARRGLTPCPAPPPIGRGGWSS